MIESLREELEELILYELTDPRVQVRGISEILLSPDGKRAQVRLALDGDAAAQKATLEALTGAKGFLRRELAIRLTLFRVPDLYFEADVAASLAPRLPHLLRRVRKGRPRPETEPNPDAPGEKKQP